MRDKDDAIGVVFEPNDLFVIAAIAWVGFVSIATEAEIEAADFTVIGTHAE